MPDGQNGSPEFPGREVSVERLPLVAPFPAAPQFERPSYVLESYKWGSAARGTSGGTITWAIVTTGQAYPNDSDYTSQATGIGAVFMPTIRAAFSRWDAVGNFSFVETTSPMTADIVLVFDELSGQSSSTIGLANTYYGSGVIRNSYISFDLGRRYRLIDGTIQTVGTTSSTSSSDFYTLVLHEVGHALGLDHENGYATVMSPAEDSSITDLTSDEINAIRALYGNPAGAGADDWAGSTATAGALIVGATAIGTIETAGDSDWYRVTLTAGVSYRFDMINGTLTDPYLNIRDSGGTVVASDNDSGAGLAASLTYTPSSSGAYYLDARSNSASGTGTYSVLVAQVSSANDDHAGSTSTTGAISVGGSVTGNIETANDRDWFRVTLTAGVTYRLDLNGGTLADPLLHVRNSSGTSLASDDDSGLGLNATLTYTPLVTGTYYIDALSATSAGTATYTLSLTKVSTTPADDVPGTATTTATISVGTPRTGSIEVGSDTDWYRVSLSAGTLYQFDGRGTGSMGGTLTDPTLSLVNSSGTVLRADNDGGAGTDARILFRPTLTGTYYLSTRSTSSTATGTYTVGATANPDDFPASVATTGTVSVGATATGIVETAGNRDWCRTTLTAGQPVHIDVRGTEVGSGLRWTESSVVLRDANGAEVSSDTRSGLGAAARITYTAATTGTFFVDALAYSVGVGSYTISISSAMGQEAPAIAEELSGSLTAAELAFLTAPPAFDFSEFTPTQLAPTPQLVRSPIDELRTASYLPVEDAHRLELAVRLEQLFLAPRAGSFDLLTSI